MLKLLNISVTYHTPRNRVSDIVRHVALHTIKGVVICLLRLATVNYETSFQVSILEFRIFIFIFVKGQKISK